MQKVYQAEHLDALADGDDRPYVDRWWTHLLALARSNWEDAYVLYAVCCEAATRVRGNPASNARKLLDKIQPRLDELIEGLFPPEPDALPGQKPFVDTSKWPQVGLLRHMGYRVGDNDPGFTKHRKTLRLVFHGPIPSVCDEAYMAQWGDNCSVRRLRKLAWSIASFANARLRQEDGDADAAIVAWKSDLEWLRDEYYEGYFHFPWPTIKH
jgi:hypothetical protein